MPLFSWSLSTAGMFSGSLAGRVPAAFLGRVRGFWAGASAFCRTSWSGNGWGINAYRYFGAPVIDYSPPVEGTGSAGPRRGSSATVHGLIAVAAGGRLPNAGTRRENGPMLYSLTTSHWVLLTTCHLMQWLMSGDTPRQSCLILNCPFGICVLWFTSALSAYFAGSPPSGQSNASTGPCEVVRLPRLFMVLE